MAPPRTPRRRTRRTAARLLLASAVVMATALQGGLAHAGPAGPRAVAGVGCGTNVGRVPLDTTYNPTTGRYELNDPRRGNHKTYDMQNGTGGSSTVVTDDDNTWCEGGRQSDAVAAHYIHAVFWDYLLEVHGRKGVRGDGKGGCSRVHYGRDYVNAFYESTSNCVTYGDGTSNPARPLIRIEVGAHEMTHGVTAATAGLGFSGEPGGLNEATSDLVAAAVEFRAANPADPGDYLFGERVDAGGQTALRYMDRPSRDGQSKDHWYAGIGQLPPAHSAGPANHFFYLLAEGSGPKVVGGVSYDSPTYDGKPVTGVGRAAAERISFRALTQYLTSSSTYRSARTATLAAAAALYGTDSAEHRAVGAAWAAVNVT
ncbi:Transglutaminase-activating metalloprotease precursor [Streptomyces sp. YIM 121038]|uniref:M4 family metallopeptidase n=1 Tax=Streptomyces sp. YIM 121038 TaxID=2136401 RepID=UPI001161FD98|nr:M4 family metallopeptidase [Streptomyces sp. YIM 121038]QCX81580.1 Transglutaminase-activating metalloprotease precursor [Streptomyces sp. YIM 121038]